MRSTIPIPSALREVLGRSQRPPQMVAMVVLAVVCLAVLAHAGSALWWPLAWWQRLIAGLLVLDIVAGCLSNFTVGTNDFYAASLRRRVVFLAIHVHLLVLHWALEQPLAPAVVVWVYAIVGAAVVAAIRTRENQLFTGAALLVGAITWTVLLQVPAPLLAVHLLFVMKLVLSFAVDHCRPMGARQVPPAPRP